MDNSRAMLRHAEELAGDAGVQIELLQWSIGSVAEEFRLGAQASPVHAAAPVFCAALSGSSPIL